MAPKKDKGKKDAKDAKDAKAAKAEPKVAGPPRIPECCPPSFFYPLLTFLGFLALGATGFVLLQTKKVANENKVYKENVQALKVAIRDWLKKKEPEDKADDTIVQLTNIQDHIEDELITFDVRRLEYDNRCMNSIPSVKPGEVEEKRRIFTVLYLEEPEDKAKAWPTQGFVDPKRMRFWKPYDNSYYYFSRRKKNWYEAERYCLVRDSHLASILSFEEQDFITSQVLEPAWIGLSKQNAVDTWEWTDNSAFTTRYWSHEKSQPEHKEGMEQDCVTIGPTVSTYNWRQANCYKLNRWVCKLNKELDK